MEQLEDRRMLHHGAHLPAGFTEVEVDRFVVPLPIVSPHISGVATK